MALIKLRPKTSKGKRTMLSGRDGRARSFCFQRVVERDSRYLSLLGWLLPGEELMKSMHRQDHIFHSKSQFWCMVHAKSKSVLEE